MTFESDADLEAFLRKLRENPDWRDRVRREILSDELLQLPFIVGQLGERIASGFQAFERELQETQQRLTALEVATARLIEAQTGMEGRLTALEVATARLIEAQTGTEERLTALEVATARLIEAQTGMEERLTALEVATARLIEAQARTEEALGRLIERVDRNIGRTGNLEGRMYELRFNARGRLGTRLRHVQLVNLGDFPPLQDAFADGTIDQYDWDQVLATDFILRGREGRGDAARELFVAMEVSVSVDESDVLRAERRAGILRKAGIHAQGYVAGQMITPAAREMAERLGVIVLVDQAGRAA